MTAAEASSYDFIVVGGGSAGCVAASRLVTRYGARVLLLEGGPEKRSMLATIPAGTVKIWSGRTNYLGRFFSESQPGLGGRRVPLEHGTVMGGSSTVNMMAYMRGSRADYEGWNEAAGGGWGWDDLLPYFRRQEGNERFDNACHGGDGPLKVSTPPYSTKLSHIFVKTMQRMGLPFRADLTDGDLPGVGYSQCTLANGKRCSAVEAFLDPLRGDPRLHVVTGATVTRIVVEGSSARGVEYLLHGQGQRAEATGEVVLAAGTYATPKILMLSGIGPAMDLRSHGIEVRTDLPGVGQNLQDHHYAVISASAPPGSGFYGQDRGLRMLTNGLRYLLFNDGPAAATGSESMAFIRMDDGDPEPTLQLYCMATMHPMVPKPLQSHGITLLVNLIAPKARGSVKLQSGVPGDSPKIDLGWLTDERDVQDMLNGVRYARRVLAQAPLSSVSSGEVWPGPGVVNDADLLGHIRRTLTSNHHPVGTCRMGKAGEPGVVLDGSLRVVGVDGLRVIDASMMPTLIRAATNATVMAVAEKGIDLMMAGAGGGAAIGTVTNR